MHILRIDDAAPDPIEQSRLRRLADEYEEDAAAMERDAEKLLRRARMKRLDVARIRINLGAGPVG